MNSKVQFRMFTIFDLDKVEDYLHEMHLKGWKFKSNRFGFFYFEQCQPDDVIYRVWNTSYLRKNDVDYKVLRIEDGNLWKIVLILFFEKQLVM